jgi:hypothetical protein
MPFELMVMQRLLLRMLLASLLLALCKRACE